MAGCETRGASTRDATPRGTILGSMSVAAKEAPAPAMTGNVALTATVVASADGRLERLCVQCVVGVDHSTIGQQAVN